MTTNNTPLLKEEYTKEAISFTIKDNKGITHKCHYYPNIHRVETPQAIVSIDYKNKTLTLTNKENRTQQVFKQDHNKITKQLTEAFNIGFNKAKEKQKAQAKVPYIQPDKDYELFKQFKAIVTEQHPGISWEQILLERVVTHLYGTLEQVPREILVGDLELLEATTTLVNQTQSENIEVHINGYVFHAQEIKDINQLKSLTKELEALYEKQRKTKKIKDRIAQIEAQIESIKEGRV
jgi:hypothetical protein